MGKSQPTIPSVHASSNKKNGTPETGIPSKLVLGIKGHTLAKLQALSFPTLPWAVLTTSSAGCDAQGKLTAEAKLDATQALSALEEQSKRTFGGKHPLLLTLRFSPPTEGIINFGPVVNLGLNQKTVKAWVSAGEDPRLCWDALRRLVESYALHVMGHDKAGYEQILSAHLEDAGADAEHELNSEAAQALATAMLDHYEIEADAPFPNDPIKQVQEALAGAYRRWDSSDAMDERLETEQENLKNTALILQVTASGTKEGGTGTNSGAGSCTTRVAATGEKATRVRYLETALGPDLVAGLRIPENLEALKKAQPELTQTLLDAAETLETSFQDALDIQFAVEEGQLQILSVAPLRRSAKASLRVALDLKEEGKIDEKTALRLLNPQVIDEYMHPVLDKSSSPEPLTKALPASPGSAVGQVVFFAEHAVELAAQGIKTILVRHETTPEDIDGLKVAEGIITGHGGLTSHAAVVARGMGKCCIVGANALNINYNINEMTVNGVSVGRMDWLSMDGNTGEIYAGQLPQVQPTLEGGIATVLEWADHHRRLGVFANADTAEDARRAVELGAGGIGLCRTEHMFFDIDRIPLFRKMILAVEEVGRSAALAELLPLQRKDFMDILRVMEGRPVTIRLLDPPLNEFLPKGIRSQTRMSRAMDISVESIQQRTDALSENNPMMGHRGCRLAVTYPEIYTMQVRAIVEAACIVKKEGVDVHPEIMVPLVSTPSELRHLRRDIELLTQQVKRELGEEFPIKIGTMVETPRAALSSRAIARHADFYSFGTNDLTQMTFGFSRDDVGIFLPVYLEKGLLEVDPFVELDQSGTGRLVKMAVDEGRESNPDIRLGICGEHGGDPRSVKFFHRVGLDYVSCSPFRLPVARLAAGQAAVEEEHV